jgi:hypothetical protein
MSDISISFPPWMVAWFLLGQATPLITLALAGLLVAFLLNRGGRRIGLLRWLKLGLAVTGGAWLAGISFWLVGLVDQIRTDIYQAQHHYRLEKATNLAGLDIPTGSMISVDEEGRLYEIETAEGTVVAIDGASWRGEIRLIPPSQRRPGDRGMLKHATLAADAIIQGIPCRAGSLVEFSESGGDLLSCMLAQLTDVAAQIPDANGGTITQRIACASEREIRFRILGDQLLERCALAATVTIGSISCGGGEEIVFDGAGLGACTLASPQRIGPFELASATPVGFVSGHLDRFAIPPNSVPVTVSNLALPPGSDIHLCDRSWQIDWAIVPPGSYVVVLGIKLTGRLNFDCGKFEYGSLYEDSVVGGQRMARGAGVSHEDLYPQSVR